MIAILAKRHHIDPPKFHDFSHGIGLAILIYSILYWVWTIVIAIGVRELFRKRNEKAVRIRDWRLITTGVAGIHCFITTVFAAACVGPKFSCTARFWTVSLVLPLCVAAFQIPNAQLADFYNRNRNNRSALFWRNTKSAVPYYSLWKRASIARRTHFLIGLGAFVQITGTALFYFGSRRFHHQYGIWGAKTTRDPDDCFFGWEWIIAVIWQVIWAYGSGIVMLLQIRRVNDVYNWALETRLAVIASTVGLPLWLIFMFVQGKTIAAIDTYAPPPIWFVPGFAVSQAVLLWFPLRGVYKGRRDSYHRSSTVSERVPDASMNMMREVIRLNFDHFLDYAARTKLNCEMVIFLRDVAQWRITWMPRDHENHFGLGKRERVKCFKHAALLYFRLVDMDIAEFPVNLNGPTREALGKAFVDARYVSPKHSVLERSKVAPWETQRPKLTIPAMSPAQMKEVKITQEEAETSIIITSSETSDSEYEKSLSLLDFFSTDEQVDAPSSFQLDVFDVAYKEVERDCYNNCFRDYVVSGQYSSAVHAPSSNA